jgi:acetyl-CoA carboxylase carboxyltransferase component
MGSVVGEKIANVFEIATKRKIPIVTIATSGGDAFRKGCCRWCRWQKWRRQQPAMIRRDWLSFR